MQWNGCDVVVSRAGLDEVSEVVSVLDEAAGWLAARGVRQWPAHFRETGVRSAAEAGHVWLARVDGQVSGTITLDWADPLWGPDDGAAGYMHRFAVRRSAAGLGGWLLGWAKDRVRERDRPFLRLDCVARNRALRDYYEAAGFTHQRDVEVGGSPGQRSSTGSTTRSSLYELRL